MRVRRTQTRPYAVNKYTDAQIDQFGNTEANVNPEVLQRIRQKQDQQQQQVQQQQQASIAGNNSLYGKLVKKLSDPTKFWNQAIPEKIEKSVSSRYTGDGWQYSDRFFSK